MYSKQVFVIRATFAFTSLFRLTALWKLEITVCFLWFSLPVRLGSVKKIYFSKLYTELDTFFLMNIFSVSYLISNTESTNINSNIPI